MYNAGDIAKRIKGRAKEKKCSMREMLSACGLGINAVSQLSKGTMMSCTSLALIADYLDCSVDYLLGRAATPERGGGSISPALSRLVDAAADLTDEEVEKAVEYVDFLRASRK